MSAPAEFLALLTSTFVPLIDLMAFVFVATGTVIAFWQGCLVMWSNKGSHSAQTVWLNYSRWLVAGLTFQLAADIIETSVTPDWQDIGKLAAIALIRTFLNYFLERDQREFRERQSLSEASLLEGQSHAD